MFQVRELVLRKQKTKFGLINRLMFRLMIINVKLMIIVSYHDDNFIKRCFVENGQTLPEFCSPVEKQLMMPCYIFLITYTWLLKPDSLL